jgi:CelD/BcsL family acetyltransferase involved in cellulose biosynthesis
MTMEFLCIDPQSDPLWQRLIERYESSAFHSPNWIRVLTATYGFPVQAYVITDTAGEPVAGLPFCRIEDIRGKRLVALPFSDYCDPLVGEADHWRLLLDKLLAEQVPFLVRPLHNSVALTDERLALVNKAKWHGIDLSPDLDTLWMNLHGSARRAIRKAEKNGIVVKAAESKEGLREFFELHLNVRKNKYRMLAQPYSFFENIWEQFIEKQNGLLLLARHRGEVIGGILFLEWKDEIYYKFNASAPSYLAHRPNDLLLWNGIKYAKEKGFAHLDFGLSDWDQEGLVRYKRKFASEEKTISFLRYEPNGATSHTKPDTTMKHLLPQLTDLFTDESVPDAITEHAGDVLYRYFC